MGRVGALLRTRARYLVAGLAVLAVAGIGFQAVREPGFAQIPPVPSDRSVWIANADRSLVGRVNPSSAQLDSALAVKGSVTLLQDPVTGTPAVVDLTAHEVQFLDPATVAIGTRVAVPAASAVALGGGTVAIVDTGDGRLWWAPETAPGTADAKSTTPRATLGADPAVAIGADGTVYATSAGSDQLTVSSATGPIRHPLPARLSGASGFTGDGLPVQLTVVGDQPVVLDRGAGSVLAGGHRYPVTGRTDLQLQQPGPAADSVLLSSAQGLLRVSLSDGRLIPLGAGGDDPARPVAGADGCSYGVFSESGTVSGIRSCPFAAPHRQSLAAAAGGSVLVSRGSDVLVSDSQSGAAWVASDGFRAVTGWDAVAPPDVTDPDRTEPDDNPDSDQLAPPPPNCTGVAVGTPRAQDDTFGVRAGQATVLRVLDNDPTTDCTSVVITGVSGLPGDQGAVTVVDGGSALQVTAPPGATGTLPPIRYQVGNGVGGTAEAAVTVTVEPADVHRQPQRIRRSSTEVEAGGTVSYNVLQDYVSPTGDDLMVLSADTDAGDVVSFRPDGTISVHSMGLGVGGDHRVQFVVGDGTERVTGELTVNIAAAGSTTPISYPSNVTGVAGSTVTADPTRTLDSGSTSPVVISKVAPEAGSTDATATLDPGTGKILVAAAKPGTYYFTFQAATGDKATTGVLRADFRSLAAAASATAAPMVDIAYLPQGGNVTVDPLANDDDPRGAGLAVQQVNVPAAAAGLTAAVVDLHTVRLEAANLTVPVTVPYQLYDGSDTEQGQIRVVPVAASRRPPPPLAEPISVTVRAGDAVTIPVADHAHTQDGSPLQVSIDPAETATLPGVLFTAGSDIRYLAPVTVPSSPVVFGYTATASSSAVDPVRSGSTVTVTVVPAGAAGDRPPSAPVPITARVFAGGSISIDVPLAGIDPNGDWVTATALVAPAQPLGKAELTGTDTLSYTALDRPGVDHLQYVVSDPAGLTSTGEVTVLVVPPVSTTGPPLAPDLLASVQPGRTIRIDPLASVTDPAGLVVRLDAPAFEAPAGLKVREDSGSLLVTAPPGPTVATLRYHVINTRGLPASGAITVTVAAGVPSPVPVADDIFVPAADLEDGAGSVRVDVGSHVVNRTGADSDLTLTVDPVSAHAATVAGPSTLQITLDADRQVIAYHVQDGVGGRATAFVVVPPRAQASSPTLIAGAPPIQVNAGSSVNVDLSDYISVPGGLPQLAPQATLRITQGQADRIDDATVRITEPGDAGGSAVLYVSVRTSTGTPAVLPLSVQVLPKVLPPPLLQGTELQVEAGTSTSLDLGPFATVYDPAQVLRCVGRRQPAAPASPRPCRARC